MKKKLQEDNFLKELKQLQKIKPEKKNKFHKTSFKIPKTNENVEKLKDILVKCIEKNRKFVNDEIFLNKEYEKHSPFFVGSLDFAEELNQSEKEMRNKYGYKQKNLSKNTLLLEGIYLKKLNERENKKKLIKENNNNKNK